MAWQASEHQFERERLAAIVDSSQDAIISKTIGGVITSWNASAERLFGYTAEEAIGRHITLLIPEDRRDEEIDILARLRRGERVEHYETVRRTKDGRLIELSLTISPLRDERGNVVGASKIARDVGARKAVERELRAREEQLRLQDRRKDEFLAVLAHELRNPLAPLANSVDLLQDTGLPASVVAELAGVAQRQVSHLMRLVDDLLDMSRVTRGAIELQKQPLLLSAAVQDALETSQPLISEMRHAVTIELSPEPLTVCGDRTRLTQVISNLINNAAKYTPACGRIVITLRREGANAALSIADNGVGIPAEMLTEVFKMFAQVDRSLERTQGGVGIGLSLVRRLVELHDGKVEAHSRGRGQGAEFIVRLPLMPDVKARPEPVRAVPAELPQRRVLVADDNRDAARILTMLLQSLGQEVHVAHDGEQAFAMAAQLKPEVILLDIGMPRMNGYEVARRIRAEKWGGAPMLVALTGWGQDQDRRASAESGFDRHLVKPVTMQTLQDILRSPARATPGVPGVLAAGEAAVEPPPLSLH